MNKQLRAVYIFIGSGKFNQTSLYDTDCGAEHPTFNLHSLGLITYEPHLTSRFLVTHTETSADCNINKWEFFIFFFRALTVSQSFFHNCHTQMKHNIIDRVQSCKKTDSPSP